MIETLKLFGKVAVEQPTEVLTTDNRLISAFTLEVAMFGYAPDAALLTAMRGLGNNGFRALRDQIVGDLATITGADKTQRKLFNNFPYDTPDQHDYMEKRVIGWMASAFDVRLGGNTLTPLSCGHVIDSALFDVEEFGACPICQHAVPELSSPETERFAFASVTPLKPLMLSTDGFVREGNAMLARQSSLSTDEKTVLRSLVDRGAALTVSGPLFKETLPFAYQLLGADAVKEGLSGVTDVMRIATFLSDPEADLSLKANVKFKLSTSQRRGMLALMEGMQNLAEDMMRHRERWLRLGERLNPGTAKNRRAFPNVARAFDRLRNDPKNIVTFNRQMEEGMRARAVDLDFVRLMAERPGEFVRKLDFMLRTATDARIITAGFKQVLPKVTEKMLFELRKYLESRDALKQRVFFPKGQVNKAQIVEEKRAPLPRDAKVRLLVMIDDELKARVADREKLGRVFVDPALKDIILPFNRRGDSSTSVLVNKGSRFAFAGDVIRLFIWWANGEAGRVDVDLSMVYFDDQFNDLGHVAYTNLYSGDRAVVHSGDITNGGEGASEFIDINIDKLRANARARYVAMTVISFTGQKFNAFPCHAGFMERDAVASGKTYEPESVALKFEVKAATTAHMPLFFDLMERKVIFADISSGGGLYGRVASQGDKQKAVTEAVMTLSDRKPTAFDVAMLHAMARGEVVENRDDADRVFDLSDATTIIEEGIA